MTAAATSACNATLSTINTCLQNHQYTPSACCSTFTAFGFSCLKQSDDAVQAAFDATTLPLFQSLRAVCPGQSCRRTGRDARVLPSLYAFSQPNCVAAATRWRLASGVTGG